MTGQDLVLPSFSSSLSRRGALLRSSGVLSATAVALLGGRDALAAAASATPAQLEADSRILNTALGAELEAVAAYQVGAESGLLSPAALKVAQQFQGHHKEHAAALAGAVAKLFAAGLERGAVSAYLGAVPLFADRQLAQVAASILGDEAMHWAVLRQVLGEVAVPSAFLS
jgi:hypothetical protein